MKQFHQIEELNFEGDTMVLRADGETYRVALKRLSPRLAEANDAARRAFRVSPSGYGIHWPLIDEDLSVDGLVRAARGEAEAEPSERVGTLRDGK